MSSFHKPSLRPVAALIIASSPLAVDAAPMDFNLPSQPLEAAIKAVAKTGGLNVALDGSLVEGKTSPAVKGRFETEEALRRVLSGSGLSVSLQGGSAVIGKADTHLKEVAVVGDAVSIPKEGSAEAGYKVDTAKNVGPWGTKKLLDTPYSMAVTSSDLTYNTISSSPVQIFEKLPLTQVRIATAGSSMISNINMRGFLVQKTIIDGVRNDNTGYGMFIEDVDRIEMLSGLSGFLYGQGNVGGAINYVTKRPTSTPLYEATVGNYGGEKYFGHVDLGGPIDRDGKFGYRMNIMAQDGDTPIKDQSLTKWLASGALDWHVMDNLLIQANASTGYYKLNNTQQEWSFPANSTLASVPAAPDNKRLWTPNGTFDELEVNKVGANLKYDPNDIFSLRSGFGHFEYLRNQIYGTTASVMSNTVYNTGVNKRRMQEISDGEYAYLDSRFKTFNIEHKLTLGINFSQNEFGYGAINGALNFVLLPPKDLNLSDPNSANKINPIAGFDFNQLSMVTSSETANYNYVIGDDIKINDQWSALVGLNYSNIQAKSFNTATGAVTSSYDKSAPTPSGSLLFKPLPNLTTYASYMESLEQGTIVGPTYKNANAILEPLTSTQYEVGAKAELGKTLLTLALFQINKGNQYSNDGSSTGTFVQDGRQVHEGIELTATGKATENLTVLGGFTVMDPRVEKSNSPALEGKQPAYVSDKMAKLYAEYALPFVRGLSLTGGVYYTGESYADTANKFKVPSYTTGDLGARYVTKLSGNEAVLRLNVTNVTDENYWIVGASGLGTPRTVAFSASMKF
ncbi:TonB-dependent receptor [Methylobacter sp.]|uniref:TonB-dependent receptor n=1 Tax=Methylobacter sp. TaxID=2051955 RepID=UPI002FDEB735